MLIAIVDGQGGGIGRILIEKLRERLNREDQTGSVEILALGTNGLATAAMIKAGADQGATGENAIVVNAARADILAGSIGIIAADSLLGELTPAMAHAISRSAATKVLIPVNKCGIVVAGLPDARIQNHIDDAVRLICERLPIDSQSD